MPRLIPRTYALTAVTHHRQPLFQRTDYASAMVATILRYRAQSKYLLHGFVVMPDHIHVLLSPIDSIERSAQLIKGGFSHAIRTQHPGSVWQDGYHEHRVRDPEDHLAQLTYIANNPTRRGYIDYPHLHTRFPQYLDTP